MTTSLMVMLGCLLLTSYTMAISLPGGIYARDDDGGDADVAGVKEALDAAKAQVNAEADPEFKKPLNELLTSVGEKLAKAKDGNDDRRRFDPNVHLGGGWSVGLDGVKWQSDSGRTTFTVKPTFHGFKPDGVFAELSFHF